MIKKTELVVLLLCLTFIVGETAKKHSLGKFPYTIQVRFTKYGDGSQITSTPSMEEFKVLRELGRGGNGIVLLGKHIRSKTMVAIKETINANNLSGWEREFDMNKKLNATASKTPKEDTDAWNAGIATTYGLAFLLQGKVEPTEKTWLLFFELLGDCSWKPNLTLDEKIHLFWEMTKSTVYAHSKDVMHRDIKPDNCVFLNSLDAKNYKFPVKSFLIDWGAAKSISEGQKNLYTRDYKMPGTRLYHSLYIVHLLLLTDADIDLAKWTLPGPETDWECLVYSFMALAGYKFSWQAKIDQHVNGKKKIMELEHEIKNPNADAAEKATNLGKIADLKQELLGITESIYKLKENFSNEIQKECESLGLPKSTGEILFTMLQNSRYWKIRANLAAIKPDELLKIGQEFVSMWEKEYKDCPKTDPRMKMIDELL